MTRGAWIIAIILAALYAVLLGLCLFMDAPMREDPATFRIEVRHEPVPYPEEDTMHYITEDGTLIIYAAPEPQN